MSKYRIEAKKTTIADGIEYTAKIDKTVHIDFSDANYEIEIYTDVKQDTQIIFVPDNIDFMHEVAEIFPSPRYEIQITQNIYKYYKPYVSIYLSIYDTETNTQVFIPENATLSDKDYNYLRNILVKEAPKFKWQTIEEHLRENIENYMGEGCLNNPFTDRAFDLLSKMTSERYREYKPDSYVDFDDLTMADIAKQIIEKALEDAYNKREQKGI